LSGTSGPTGSGLPAHARGAPLGGGAPRTARAALAPAIGIKVVGHAVAIGVGAAFVTVELAVAIGVGIKPVLLAVAIDVIADAGLGRVLDLILGQDAIVVVVGILEIGVAVAIGVATAFLLVGEAVAVLVLGERVEEVGLPIAVLVVGPVGAIVEAVAIGVGVEPVLLPVAVDVIAQPRAGGRRDLVLGEDAIAIVIRVLEVGQTVAIGVARPLDVIGDGVTVGVLLVVIEEVGDPIPIRVCQPLLGGPILQEIGVGIGIEPVLLPIEIDVVAQASLGGGLDLVLGQDAVAIVISVLVIREAIAVGVAAAFLLVGEAVAVLVFGQRVEEVGLPVAIGIAGALGAIVEAIGVGIGIEPVLLAVAIDIITQRCGGGRGDLVLGQDTIVVVVGVLEIRVAVAVRVTRAFLLVGEAIAVLIFGGGVEEVGLPVAIGIAGALGAIVEAIGVGVVVEPVLLPVAVDVIAEACSVGEGDLVLGQNAIVVVVVIIEVGLAVAVGVAAPLDVIGDGVTVGVLLVVIEEVGDPIPIGVAGALGGVPIVEAVSVGVGIEPVLLPVAIDVFPLARSLGRGDLVLGEEAVAIVIGVLVIREAIAVGVAAAFLLVGEAVAVLVLGERVEEVGLPIAVLVVGPVGAIVEAVAIGVGVEPVLLPVAVDVIAGARGAGEGDLVLGEKAVAVVIVIEGIDLAIAIGVELLAPWGLDAIVQAVTVRVFLGGVGADGGLDDVGESQTSPTPSLSVSV
jgi:hypothetical protein